MHASVCSGVCDTCDVSTPVVTPALIWLSDATSSFHRTVVKWIALYAPLPWPSGIMTRPEIEQGVGGTCPGDFAADVDDLARLIDTFVRDALEAPCPPHPIFGPLSEKAWLRWGYLHVDHHLRQFGA